MEINNHKLNGGKIDYQASPNIGGEFGAGKLDTIILHYTAGASRESSVRSLSKEKNKVSAHLVVGRDGKTTQLVPFNTIAWHAGKSEYKGRKHYNNYSIGIEIDNVGILTKDGDKYLTWFKKECPEDNVVKAIHRNKDTEEYWQTYTDEQIEICKGICKLLIDEYGITEILGHEEISPLRKSDPGPAFPLDAFRNELLNR